MAKFSERFILACALLTAFFSVSTVAHADENKTSLIGVVELFTSQGCSSCPPADAALQEYIERDDVLALAYHVPYWDYLGWKDTLATDANEARQRGYRKTFGERTVYTPQAVINGRDHVVGSRSGQIASKLQSDAFQNIGLRIPVDIERHSDRLRVSVEQGDVTKGKDVKLVLVYYRHETTVDIKRGENTGRKITYRNTVSDTQVLGMWDGKEMQLEIPYNEISANKADGCAVLLQEVGTDGTPGAILGAAILRSPDA